MVANPEMPFRSTEEFLNKAQRAAQGLSFKKWAGGDRVTLALVFTDIVGSTALNSSLGDAGMGKVREKHCARARKILKKCKGFEIKTIGDSFMVAFRSVEAALDFSQDLHRDTGHPEVRIRAGIHLGPMDASHDDAFGQTVNYAARVVAAISDAEIWLSSEAKTHLDISQQERFAGLSWQPRHRTFKGFKPAQVLWAISDRGELSQGDGPLGSPPTPPAPPSPSGPGSGTPPWFSVLIQVMIPSGSSGGEVTIRIGSGTAIQPGLVLTARHVVFEHLEYPCQIRFDGSQDWLKATVVWRHPTLDLALLSYHADQQPDVVRIDLAQCCPGEAVTGQGHPSVLDGEAFLCNATIQGKPSGNSMVQLMQTSFPAQAGETLAGISGMGWMNPQGKLVAVMHGTIEKLGAFYATPVQAALEDNEFIHLTGHQFFDRKRIYDFILVLLLGTSKGKATIGDEGDIELNMVARLSRHLGGNDELDQKLRDYMERKKILVRPGKNGLAQTLVEQWKADPEFSNKMIQYLTANEMPATFFNVLFQNLMCLDVKPATVADGRSMMISSGNAAIGVSNNPLKGAKDLDPVWYVGVLTAAFLDVAFQYTLESCQDCDSVGIRAKNVLLIPSGSDLKQTIGEALREHCGGDGSDLAHRLFLRLNNPAKPPCWLLIAQSSWDKIGEACGHLCPQLIAVFDTRREITPLMNCIHDGLEGVLAEVPPPDPDASKPQLPVEKKLSP